MTKTSLPLSFDPNTGTALVPIGLSELTLKRFENCGFVGQEDTANAIALGERISVIVRELAEELESVTTASEAKA